MQQILFIAEIPEVPENSVGTTVSPRWLTFEDGVNTLLKQNRACKRHQKNAWLLPVECAWPSLIDMSNLATKSDFAYSVLLISGDVIDMTATTKK